MLTSQLALLAVGFGVMCAGIGAALAVKVYRRKYLVSNASVKVNEITPERLVAVFDSVRRERMQQSKAKLTHDKIDVLCEVMAMLDEVREREPKGGVLYDRLDVLHREADLIVQDFAPAQLHPVYASRPQLEEVDAMKEPFFIQNPMHFG